MAITVLFAGALPAMAAGGNDFVCPVWNSDSQAGAKNPNAVEIGGGDYTIIPGLNRGNSGKVGTQRADTLNVPDGATNMNGDGTPGGTHASPGDSDYSAIWNGDAS